MLLILSGLWVSCKKDDNGNDPVLKPVITSIQPSGGTKGTQVVIMGENFSNNISDVTVYINGKIVQVIAVSANSITIVVPPKTGTGNVEVFVKGEAGTGPVFNFVYTVTVTAFSGNGIPGFADGNGANAQYNSPRGMTIDEFDNIYVADELNHCIRVIAPNGQVNTFAGIGIAGHEDGNATTAKFNRPHDIKIDAINGFYYVADRDNHCIRRISNSGTVTTAIGTPGAPGFTDGPTLSARLNSPCGVALQGELTNIYIADAGNHCIRKADPNNILTTFAGTNISGQADGSGSGARFNEPFAITWDTTGNLFVTDVSNHNIRKITTSGFTSTIAGAGIAGYSDGTILFARFDTPSGIYAENGELFICDMFNQRIRGVSSGGITSTIAGLGTPGNTNGNGSVVTFNNPAGIVRNSNGDFFISETGNHVIRKMIID